LELIEEKLNTVKVNRKTPAQEMEYSFVKTQVYAIIWGRLDKRKIIRIEGAEMKIKFKEDTRPISVKSRHQSPLERANLRFQIQKILSQDVIKENSKSEWSSVFQLVAIMGKLHNVYKDHTDYAYDWLHDSTWNDEKPFDDRAVMINTQQQAHRRTTEALRIAEAAAQLAVSKSIRYNLHFLMYEGTGHAEHKLTMLSIRSKNHWPYLFGDAFEHVKKCYFCQQREEAYPRLKKASTVAAHMVTHLFQQRHKVPRQRVTDNGSEFDNGRLQMVWDIIDLEQRVFIAPQNPRSDGAVEKQKATLKDVIASYVKDTTEFLSMAVFQYNTVGNEATTFIPVFMAHGREAGTPEDAHLCQFVERCSSVNAYIEQMRKALKAVWTGVGVESRVDIEEWNRNAQNEIKYKTLSGTASTKGAKITSVSYPQSFRCVMWDLIVSLKSCTQSCCNSDQYEALLRFFYQREREKKNNEVNRYSFSKGGRY
jgi:hypothetical protein